MHIFLSKEEIKYRKTGKEEGGMHNKKQYNTNMRTPGTKTFEVLKSQSLGK